MSHLALMIPTVHCQADFIVRSRNHILHIAASPWFRLRAAISRTYAVKHIMEFCRDEDNVQLEDIISIRQRNRSIYRKVNNE